MRAVVDTNVIVSYFLFPNSVPGQVMSQWVVGAFDLLVSEELISEYKSVLARRHIAARHELSDDEVADSLERFREFGLLVEPRTGLRIVTADPKDDVFVQTAVAGKADYIVSGDHHLLDLRRYEGIQIVTPAAFLAILESGL